MELTNSNGVNSKESSDQLNAIALMSNILAMIKADGSNVDTVIPDLFEIALDLFKAENASIILTNKNHQVTKVWLANETYNTPENRDYFNLAIEKGPISRVIHNKQAQIIHDTLVEENWIPFSLKNPEEESWSAISAPFLVRNKAIGAVTVSKPGKNQFNNTDLDILNMFVNQASNIIEKAHIVLDFELQLQISHLLNEASRSINSSLDLNEVMKSMLMQMNEFLRAEAISIALVDKQSNELVYQVAAGIGSKDIVGLRLPSNQGISGWVMEHGKPALVQDVDQEPRIVTLGDERTGHRTRAMICAPITYKSQVLGTIQAINPTDEVFTQSELDLLVNLANIASSAIANAQQFARTQEAESRYTSLYQDSIDPIIITEVGGQIADANRRAFAFLGYPPNELIEKHIRFLHRPEAILPNTAQMEPNSIRVFNSQMVRKNGRSVHVEVYVKRTSYGDSEYVQWIYHDISKQIELEEMRKDLQAMLFHDLQSPLGNVISSLELLTYELPENSSPALLEMLDIARRSSSRLQTLIRSLLDINQLEAGHPISEQNRTHVQDLVDDAWETVKPGYEKRNISLVQEIPEDLPDIFAEDDMLRRVLVNLLDNAVKYSPKSKQVILQAEAADDNVLIRVCDQGEGIPEEYRTLVFEKFRRIDTDTYSKGLGLGLAFCRLSVEAHGGKIWVDDSPGGGARFNFTIPRWKEDKDA
ncbi:MAG: hypothetical protein CSB13_09575 [Chloroflexi bacterium]|nr:MAG: hypothetical protein CSB13_09575 [Chloroflexota bacterium]